MRDEDFQFFIENFGEAFHRTPVPELSLRKFQDVLPRQFLKYWREEGWCGYSDGLFWTVNPEEYKGLVELWLADTPFEKIDKYHVVARSAFGKLYAWGERNNQTLVLLCPTHSLIATAEELRTPAEDPELAARVFFSALEKKGLDMKDTAGKGLFAQALKALGPLGPDEIYGFEPALVAGGQKQLKNLSKVNLFAHLAVLRELAEPRIPFD